MSFARFCACWSSSSPNICCKRQVSKQLTQKPKRSILYWPGADGFVSLSACFFPWLFFESLVAWLLFWHKGASFHCFVSRYVTPMICVSIITIKHCLKILNPQISNMGMFLFSVHLYALYGCYTSVSVWFLQQQALSCVLSGWDWLKKR